MRKFWRRYKAVYSFLHSYGERAHPLNVYLAWYWLDLHEEVHGPWAGTF